MSVETTNQSWDQSLLALAQVAWENDPHTTKKASPDSQMLQSAYERCRLITAEHSRSFFMATALLPRAKREAVRALYAFCRLADDLVDEGHDRPGPELQRLREKIHHIRLMEGENDLSNEVLVAWEDARARYHVPIRFVDQLLDGVERDLHKTRYTTFEELSLYCYGVASTVGLMSMHIIGFSPEAVPYAVKMGVALQLTNILRDVGEDFRAGRVYLPLEELAAFGLNDRDLASQRVDERWRNLVRFQIARTRQIYAEALPGLAYLDPSGQLSTAAAAVFYQGILDDIEAHDYNVFTRRAHVNEWGKIKLLARLMMDSGKYKLGIK